MNATSATAAATFAKEEASAWTGSTRTPANALQNGPESIAATMWTSAREARILARTVPRVPMRKGATSAFVSMDTREKIVRRTWMTVPQGNYMR